MGETEDYNKSATPTAHASTHEDGGSDEISVDGLAGELVDNQPSTWTMVSGKPTTFTPAAHKTSHQDAGSDEISVQGLAGTLADAQTPAAHKTSHQDAGSDEISVEGLAGELTAEQKSAWTKVSGKPTTFDPSAHKTSHQDGGSDEISVQGLSGTLADDQHILDAEVLSYLLGLTGIAANRHLFVNAAGTGLEWASGHKVTLFTRDSSLAAGDQAVTGVGFKPSRMFVLANVGATGKVSFGFGEISNETTIYYNYIPASPVWERTTGCTVYAIEADGSYYYGTLKSMDSDGFTISWVKGGITSGTIFCFCLVFR